MKQKFKDFFINIKANQTVSICAFLSVLYLISGYWKWLEIAVSIVAIVCFVILPLQKSFNIFLYLHCFTLSNIGYDSCFMVTLIGFTIVLLVKYIIGVKKSQYPVNTKLIRLISLFTAISLGVSIPNGIYYGALLYLFYLPFFYLLFEMRHEFDIREGMNYMFGGLLTTSLLALICLVFPMYQYDPFAYNRFAAFINQPNYLYMRALFVLCYFMFRYLSGNLTTLKFSAIYLICSMISIATISKTGIVMWTLITFTFFILYLKKDFKKRIKFVAIFLVIVASIGLLSIKFIAEVFERFADNFKASNILNALLTGRDEIWIEYLKETFKSPLTCLFGNGLIAQEVYIPSQSLYRASHNLYIFLLYRFGILGCAFLGYIIYCFIKELCHDKPKFIAYLPLLFLLLESFCDNTFKCYNFTYFAFAIMILFSGFHFDETQNKTVNENNKN